MATSKEIPAHEGGLSRRDVLRLFGGGAGIAVIGGTLFNRYGPDVWSMTSEAYGRYREYTEGRGYHLVTPERKRELVGDIIRIPLPSRTDAIHPEEGIIQKRFYVPFPGTVHAEATERHDAHVSFQVLEAQRIVDGKPQGLIYEVPLLRTRHNNSVRFIISPGPLRRGEHVVRLKHTSASADIDENAVYINFYVVLGSPFAMSVYRDLPIIAMRRDNHENDTPANDAPVFREIYIREHENDGTLMQEVWEGYTAEDKGTQAVKLLQETDERRAFDFDVSVLITKTPDGNVLEVAHQEDTKRKSHDIVVTHSYDADDPKRRIRPYYHSVEKGKHGMVAPGLERDRDGNLITRVFTLEPIAYPEVQTVQTRDFRRGVRINALREEEAELLAYFDGEDIEQDIAAGNHYRIAELLRDHAFIGLIRISC